MNKNLNGDLNNLEKYQILAKVKLFYLNQQEGKKQMFL